MPRPLTATTASIDFRLLHFGRRSAKSYGQFLTAWVENRKLTLPLDPSRCRTPFALRNSLPRRHDASPLLTVAPSSGLATRVSPAPTTVGRSSRKPRANQRCQPGRESTVCRVAGQGYQLSSRGACRSTRHGPAFASRNQAALTSIILGVTARGAGTLTSSMPFTYFASTCAASTPSGRAKSRWNAP